MVDDILDDEHPASVGHDVLDGCGILSRGPVFSVGVTHRVPLDQATAMVTGLIPASNAMAMNFSVELKDFSLTKRRPITAWRPSMPR